MVQGSSPTLNYRCCFLSHICAPIAVPGCSFSGRTLTRSLDLAADKYRCQDVQFPSLWIEAVQFKEKIGGQRKDRLLYVNTASEDGYLTWESREKSTQLMDAHKRLFSHYHSSHPGRWVESLRWTVFWCVSQVSLCFACPLYLYADFRRTWLNTKHEC